jgi:hypothetical protein
MKLLYKYVILSVFLVPGLTSCTDFLDVVPDNVATIENAFSDRYTSEKYLYTCYSFLPNYGSAWDNPTLLGGDEVWYPDRLYYNAAIRIARGEQNIVSPLFDFWGGGNGGKQLYVGIRSCNIFLEKIGGVQDLPDYEKRQWIAEVKFLKAYYHFYLTRMYGPIHITDESVAVSAETEAIKVKRDHVDSCFNYTVTLMDEAIADLPLQRDLPSTELGRVTQPIAMAIKARVLVTAASPLFNGNPDYATFANKDGETLFTSTYDKTKWEKAATACREAIDISHQVGHKLFDRDELITVMEYNDSLTMKLLLRSRITKRWNPEIIWGGTSGIVGSLQYEAQPRLYSAVSNPVAARHAPTLRIAEQYYTKNGVPINEDVEYDYGGRFNLRTVQNDHRYFIEFGEQTAALHFDREYRFYADIAHDRSLWFGNGKTTDPEDSWAIHGRRGEYSSVFEVTQYSVTGYWAKKLCHTENEIRDGNWYYIINYPFPVIRLADLYLYYAEALNEVKAGPDEEVYEYIDMVRERAGLQGVVDSWENSSSQPDKPKTKAGMRKIIQQERLIEMAFEGARFWDLRRWKLGQEYMNKPVKGWNVLKNDVREYYRTNTLHMQSFSVQDYLWPIEENEIVLNPSLVQNPGW